MTYDTEENNDPFKINISLEDDKDNHRKKWFEKGLGALLADEHFLLLYVPENGAKMQIIQPASDSYHRQRMIKRINEARDVPSFYYALSHLWGISRENPYHWNEISDYVDDEQGQPVKPVSMRPEKRDKLLAMLMDHPDSYWWIDVLCARTNTPLDIMGDIYACSLECIAMVDCDPTLISEINKTNAETSQKLKQQLWLHLHKFIKSQWWQRVWTWQEMALPLDVRFMAETGAYHPESTITMKEILAFNQNWRILNLSLPSNERKTLVHSAEAVKDVLCDVEDTRKFTFGGIAKKSESELYYLFSSLRQSPRRCMDSVDYVYGVLGVLQFKIPRKKDPNEVWQLFLHALTNHMGDSTRGAEFFDRAVKFDLLKAESLGEVYHELYKIYTQMYGGFGHIRVGFAVSPPAVDVGQVRYTSRICLRQVGPARKIDQ